MTVQRVLWWGFWLFCLFFIVTNPSQAASVLQGIWAVVCDAATQFAAFLTNVFR